MMSPVKRQAFSQWLTAQLERKGKSQTWLQHMLGSSHGTVNHWMAGRRIPSPKNCHKIADALGVDPDEVLAIAGHRPLPVPVEQMSPEATIIAKVRKIDWLREPAVYRLVRNMLDNIIHDQHTLEPGVEPSVDFINIAD